MSHNVTLKTQNLTRLLSRKNLSGSAYNGVRGKPNQRHAWGYGCSVCPACELRAKGFAVWQAQINDLQLIFLGEMALCRASLRNEYYI
jgi:7-cyano-7-deazaguanine synthase in queuosine biosynthesis